MKTSIKTFFETHKTAIMISSVVLVLVAKSVSMANQADVYGHSTPQGINGQPAPQNNSGNGFWSNVFNGNEEPVNATTNYATDPIQAFYGTDANQGYYGNAGQTYYGTTGNGASYTNTPAADYTSGYYAQQASNDRISENYSDYMRDQANYDDAYGNTYKLNSGYSNTYVNNTTGEYVQSNDANYDPNYGSTSSWSAVTPSSSYSSSSYSSSSSTESE